MNINLHIGQLVLEGLPLTPGQDRAVQIELAGELTRLLEKRGIGGLSGPALPYLSLPPIQLSPDGPPAQWGRQIARTLFAGLAPTASTNSDPAKRRHEPAGPPSPTLIKNEVSQNRQNSRGASSQ